METERSSKRMALEFDLPEESCAANIAFHSMDWALAVLELDNALRGKLKYGHDFKDADSALEWCRNQLHEELKSGGVSTDDIE